MAAKLGSSNRSAWPRWRRNYRWIPPLPVFEIIAGGFGGIGRVVGWRCHGYSARRCVPPENLRRMEQLQHELEARDGWRWRQRVEPLISRLRCRLTHTHRTVRRLAAGAAGSGAGLRAGFIAVGRADQPSRSGNHPVAGNKSRWNFADRCSSLPRPRPVATVGHPPAGTGSGHVDLWPGDYANFLEKKAALLGSRGGTNAKFDKNLAQGRNRFRRGTPAAPATRGCGPLLALREEHRQRREQLGKANIALEQAETPAGW